MDKKEPARLESVILARGIDAESHIPCMEPRAQIIYFNRNELLGGLKSAGIPFEVVSAGFAYYGSPDVVMPYQFVLHNLLGHLDRKKEVTLNLANGEVYRKFTIPDFTGCSCCDSFPDVNEGLIGLLDERSQQIIRTERALKCRDKYTETMDYYNAGMLLYLNGDMRLPEQVLEEHLQARGYPVKIAAKSLKWTKEFPACLNDPALELRISIAPEVFGTLTDEDKVANSRMGSLFGFKGYNYGSGTVSGLCLRDLSKIEHSGKIEYKQARLIPFFLHSDGKQLVDPIKARDILRIISQYAKFEEIT